MSNDLLRALRECNYVVLCEGSEVANELESLLATERERVIEKCAKVADAHRSTCAAAIRALKGVSNG